MHTYRVHAKSDSFVDEANPKKNYGNRPVLHVRAGSGTHRYGLLHFPMPRRFTKDFVVSATLTVQCKDDWTGVTLTVKRVTSSWAEDKVNWNNQPTVSTLHSATGTESAGEIQVDITDLLNDVAGGSKYYGLQISSNSSTDHKVWSSEADRADQPELFLEYVVRPDPPVNLRPDQHQLYDATPRLRWQRPPTNSGNGQAYSEVQIATPDGGGHVDWTTPDYDSGKVANTDLYWLPDTPASGAPGEFGAPYVGCAEGARAAWRVRFWDEAGAVSDWSDSAEFSFSAAGVASWTDPVDGSDVVDTTPTATWSWTPGVNGRDPAHIRIILDALDADGSFGDAIEDTDWEVWDSSYDFTPQRHEIRRENVRYRLRVFVNDGDDSWGFSRALHDALTPEAQTTFFLTHADSIPVVYNLAQDEFGPGIVLEWNNDLAVPPDQWLLVVDGHILNEDIEGTDALDSYDSVAVDALDLTVDTDSDNIADGLDTSLIGSPTSLSIDAFNPPPSDVAHGQHFIGGSGTNGVQTTALPVRDNLQVTTASALVFATSLAGGAEVRLRMEFFDASNVSLGHVDATTTTTGTNVSLLASQAAPATSDHVILSVVITGGTSGEVDVAAVELDEVTGSFSWTWYGARPHIAHVVDVRAKVDGVGISAPSGGIDVEFDPVGIWLVETKEKLWVPIMGQANVSQQLSRDGGTFYLVNREDPVRIDGKPRGFYGAVTGTLVDDDNAPALTYLSLLELLVGKFSNSPHLHLVFGHDSFPVVIADFVKNEWPVSEGGTTDVAFNWWQTGNFDVPGA